jgi:phage/plasmid-like protein (TIGR03299 family)
MPKGRLKKMTNDVPTFDISELLPEHMQINEGTQFTAPVVPVNRSPVFDVRGLGWDNISVPVPNTVTEALYTAKLDWTVMPRPVVVDGAVVMGRVANVRSDLPVGQNVLEIVGSKYQIVQNHEALDFVQSIVDTGDMTLANAGALNGGRTVFLLGKTEGLTVRGEKIAPYVLFSNSHDGTSAVNVCITSIRVVCQNTLALALKTAPRVWSLMHTKSATEKMEAALKSMNFIGTYLTEYPSVVENMMDTTISETQFGMIADTLFPIPVLKEKNKAAVTTATAQHDMFVHAYIYTPDLRSHVGTAWGVYNAYSDYVSHAAPMRATKRYEETRFARNMGGQNLERAQQIIMRVASA